jgi:hypothetical protein
VAKLHADLFSARPAKVKGRIGGGAGAVLICPDCLFRFGIDRRLKLMRPIRFGATAGRELYRLAERQGVAVEVTHFNFPDPVKLQTWRSGNIRTLGAEFRVQRVNIIDP